MLLPALPKNAVVFVLVCIWNFATRGVREVHSTARAAADRLNDRAAWDDTDDSLHASSVFFLQRMFFGFGFVGNRHNDRGGLDSSSNSRVPNHGAPFLPSMPVFSGNPMLPRIPHPTTSDLFVDIPRYVQALTKCVLYQTQPCFFYRFALRRNNQRRPSQTQSLLTRKAWSSPTANLRPKQNPGREGEEKEKLSENRKKM